MHTRFNRELYYRRGGGQLSIVGTLPPLSPLSRMGAYLPFLQWGGAWRERRPIYSPY